MRAYNLESIEKKFKSNLVDAYGKKWVTSAGEFDGVVRLRTSDSTNFFYPENIRKQKIIQHLTHGVITGDIGALSQPNNHVSTAFVMARDGTIYQLFPSSCWSYHLGSNTSAPNSVWSPKTIAIEASCIGPLAESPTDSNILIDAYNKPYCTKSDTQFYTQVNYRGYKYFATLTDAQYTSIDYLVEKLCAKHGIVFSKMDKSVAFDYHAKIPNVTYLFHSNVRKDKVDCGPAFLLDRIG